MKRINLDTFDIIRHKKLIFSISIALVLFFIASVFLFGFNLDVDFTGGATLTVDFGRATTVEDSDALETLFKDTVQFAPSSIQRTGESQIVVKSTELNATNREALQTAIVEKFKLSTMEGASPISFDNIGGSVSKDIQRSVILSTIIAIVLMLVYITFRFELKSALAAIVCLTLNVIAMLLFYSVFQISVNSNLIACILTILGYSINNTIIVFDRVREIVKSDPMADFNQVINTSVSKSFTRTLNSSITTLLTITMIYIMGTPSVRNFTLPLMIGIVAGFFTSIYLAGPFWSLIRSKKDTEKTQKMKKIKI
ncbi:MAG TPA: protein translocase subunit SecF [Clostridiales bacterium]|nr:protein translocase subunit SecF [Clostridiales bacterium]